MPADPLFDGTRIAVNVNGHAFSVWDITTRERWSRDGSTAQAVKVWMCKAADRVALCQQLCGGSAAVAAGVVFVYGWPYPDYPRWVVKYVDAEPIGLQSAGANQVVSEWYRLTIYFGFPNYDINSLNATGEIEVQTNANSVALDYYTSAFKYAADNVPLGPEARRILSFGTLTVWTSLYDRGSLNPALAAALLDHVNNAPLYGFAAETARYLGMRSRRTITAAGFQHYTIQQGLEIHPYGWNTYPRPGATPLWQRYVLNDGSKEFPLADLTVLYQ